MHKALALFAAAFVTLFAARASASFHATKVVQVFAGSPAAPNASYVQIQAFAAGQNFLGTHSVTVYDAAGVELFSVALADVANGADQANVLIGTSSVKAAFGVAPDFTLPQNLVKAGGKVCFESSIDCFSWGNYAGDRAGTGTPFAALTNGLAAKRDPSGGTDPVLLDNGDGEDTDDSAADFDFVAPRPTNNNGVSGSLPDAGTPDASTPPGDASAPGTDSGTSTPPAGDGGSSGSSGGVGAVPPVVAGPTDAADDSGCSLGSHPSSGWSATLGLAVAAAMLVATRRRRRR